MFEAQTKIIKKEISFDQVWFAKGQLDTIKWILTKQLSERELQIILDKKTKLIKWEEKLKILNDPKRAEDKKSQKPFNVKEEIRNFTFFQNLLKRERENQQSFSASSSKVEKEAKKEETQVQAQTMEVKTYNTSLEKK